MIAPGEFRIQKQGEDISPEVTAPFRLRVEAEKEPCVVSLPPLARADLNLTLYNTRTYTKNDMISYFGLLFEIDISQQLLSRLYRHTCVRSAKRSWGSNTGASRARTSSSTNPRTHV